MKTSSLFFILLTSGIFLVGCEKKTEAPKTNADLNQKIDKITLLGFEGPECVAIDPVTGDMFVSNMVYDDSKEVKERYWGDDQTGYISRLNPDGTLKKKKWREAIGDTHLSSPKGMIVFDGKLYVNDNSRVMVFPVEGEEPPKIINIPGAQLLNDLASDGTSVYTTDTGAGKVYRLTEEGAETIKAPEGMNGVTFHEGKMYGLSFALHEAYELDPTGKEEPKSLELGKDMKNCDGIEVADDDTLIISDFGGDKIWACRKLEDGSWKAKAIYNGKSPADFAYDRKNDRLIIPSVLGHNVVIIKDIKQRIAEK